MTACWPILGVFAAVGALTAVSVWAGRGVSLYWGRPGTGTSAPMSRFGLGCFAALVWSMIALIAAGSAGVPHARWLMVAIWGALLGGAMAAHRDTRAHRRPPD